MFVYNLKLNGKSITKVVFVVISIAIIFYFAFSAYKIYSNSFKVKDEIKEPDVMNLTANNYTNILKSVYDDVDSYVGKKICFTGYVYRLIDFKDTEFVLARDMVVNNSDMQTLIVGFLCDYKNAQEFADESWVEITGEITKGDYHGDTPIIKVKKIKQIEKPQNDIYACPPDDTYIPTSSIF